MKFLELISLSTLRTKHEKEKKDFENIIIVQTLYLKIHTICYSLYCNTLSIIHYNGYSCPRLTPYKRIIRDNFR